MAEDVADFDVVDFARLLARLPEHLPISDAFEGEHPQGTGRWWTSQREHMTSWFRAHATTGSGAYTRERPNRSARRTWQRLASPGGMLWIAEALGVDPDVVQRAAEEVAAQTDKRRRTGIIRTHIPWTMIAALAQARMEEMRALRWVR